MSEDLKFINLFVYGTLRKGQPLHNWLRGSIVEYTPGVAHGYVLHSNTSRSFPYMLHGDGDVHGDLYTVAATDEVFNIAQMEQGAGYDIEVIDIETEGGTVPAAAFVLNRASRSLGQRIHGGDWVRFASRMQRKTVQNSSFGPIALAPNRG